MLRLLLTYSAFLLFFPSFAAAQATQKPAEAATDETAQTQTATLKAIRTPTVPYPEEALKKDVMGKVTLKLVVNGAGKVSDAKALSGPPELFEAAIESAKQWQFEPPAHAPAETLAEVIYTHDAPCPGPSSEIGIVALSTRLKSARGTVIDARNELDPPSPYFNDEDRKAGIAGEMILMLTINRKGKVTKVRVVKSLSPRLDKGAARTMREWKFKLNDGSPAGLPYEFQVRILYIPSCYPKF